MKQKVLLLFAMLSLSVTGAWAWSYEGDRFVGEEWEDEGYFSGNYEGDKWDQAQIPGTFDAHMTYYGDVFKLYQCGGTEAAHGGIAADEDGWTAQYGITFSAIENNSQAWIKSISVSSEYSLGAGEWGYDDLSVENGEIVNYVVGNGIVTFTILVNGPSCTFSTNGNPYPHFNFVINYLEGTPVPLDTRSQLEGLVSDYKNKKALVYHTRDFKENVATTICLPFGVEPDETGEFADGTFYELTTVTFDEDAYEWVATMTPPGLNQVDGKYTEAHKPYLFLPNKSQKITFTGTINPVANSVEDYETALEYKWGTETSIDAQQNLYSCWFMRGTYDRVTFADLTSGDEPLDNAYGFVSAFNTDESTGEGTAIDFTNEDVYAGEFVRATGAGYFPIFRAFLSYTEYKLAARGEARQNAAPKRIAVRLVNNDGSVTKLDNVEIPVISNVWYDLQGRSYNGKPAKAGIYMNNGKKMIVK